MKRLLLIFPPAILVLLLVLLGSCSVKMDRSSCPCILILDLSETEPEHVGGRLIFSVHDGHGFELNDTLELASADGCFRVDVPRTGVQVNLWSESASGFVGGDGLVIPLGEDCPPVMMFSKYVETACESKTEKVTLNKNYCRLTIMMDEGEGLWPYQLSVCGDVDGYGFDGHPRSGEFCHYPLSNAVGDVPNASTPSPGNGEPLVCELSLPRQRDSSLKLNVLEKSSVLKTFALGNYILSSGYDWAASDLEDIVIRIDYACTKVWIKVGSWENQYDFDIIF